MAKKNMEIQLQVNTSFVTKGADLVKGIENQLNKADLGKKLTKEFSDGLNKAIKDLYTGLDKIGGLGSKGLNVKEYTTAFNNIVTGMSKSIAVLSQAGEEYTKIFTGEANREGLKALKERKALLEDIKKIQTSMKMSSASASNTSSKLKNEFGLDTSNAYVRDTLKGLADKRSANKKAELSSKEAGVLGKFATDEASIKRIIELYKQEAAAIAKVVEKRELIKDLAKEEGIKTSFDNIIPAIQESITKMGEGVITAEQFKHTLESIGDGTNNIGMLEPSLIDENTAALKESQIQAEKTAQAQANLREVMAQFGIVLSAGTIARAFKDLIKSSFEFYKSLDSALNEIYVVSNLSIGAVNDLQSGFINMAKNTGMALDDITKSAVLFYQQGLSTDEVMEMTRVTSEFAKVAGIDATDAANKLTAAVNGYRLSAEDAIRVADKFNKVAAASAADINELSTAFSKAAAQANQAGISMDNYLAYIATMEEATREAPENIGTSLKTIFSRMQQIKEGSNTEDTTDVNAVETALKTVNIQLRDTEGQLRDLEEIFDELGPKWNQLDRNTQAYIGTIVAGTRQQSRFITLMQNWDRVLELSEESSNSAGQQALMHAKAMESIESKLQQLHVAWQEFVANLSSSDLFKGAISMLTNLINLVNKGQRPFMLLSLAVVALSSKLKDLGALAKSKAGQAFSNLFGSLDVWKSGGYFTSQGQKDTALAQNEERIKALKLEKQEIEQRNARLSEGLVNEVTNLTTIKTNKEGIKQIDEEIVRLEREKANLEQKQVLTSRQARGQRISQVGMASMALGATTGDANTSGLLTGGGMTAMGIGRIIANPADIGGWISSITGVVSLAKTIADWGDNLKKKLEDAANAVNQKLESAGNVSTQIKSSQALIKQYNSLSKKVIKTTADQEKLNDTIRQLGDIHSIDVIEDEYGNLLIDINEVNKALEEMKEKQVESLEELRKQEIDAIADATGGLFNSNTVEDAMDKIFKTSKSKYRDLMNDFEDGLTKDTRKISDTLSKTLQSNLKNSLMKDLQTNADIYSTSAKGLGGSLLANQENFNNLKSSDWNSLYSEIDFLKNNLSEMSYEEVQQHMDAFYAKWSGNNIVIGEQWEILKDSINNTIFDNKSLTEFFARIGTLEKKANGSYYDNKIEQLNKNIDYYQGKVNGQTGGILAAGAGGALAGAGVGAVFGGIGAVPGALIGGGIGLIGGALWSLFSEESKQLRAAKEWKEKLEKEKAEFYEDIAKSQNMVTYDEDEHEYKYDTEAAEKYTQAQINLGKALENTKLSTQSFLTSLQEFSNYENFAGDTAAQDAENYTKIMTEVMNGLDNIQLDSEKVNFLAKYYREHQSEMSENVKAQYQKIINQAFEGLAMTSYRTFTQLGEELKTISSDLQKMNKIMEDFKENGAMSLDTFIELAEIIDGIDISALGGMEGGTEYINELTSAMHNLDLAFDANNGMITANKDAMTSLQKIQEIQTKAKIAGMIAELKVSRATVETEIAMIDGQIAATEAAIKAMEADTQAKLTAEEIKQQADKMATETTINKVNSIKDSYDTDVSNVSKWKQAVITSIADATDAWNQYYTARKEGATNVDELYKKAQRQTQITWTATDSTSGVDWQSYKTGDLASQAKTISQLKDYLSALRNTRAQSQLTLDNINTQINLLDDMFHSDLSQLGTSGKGGDTLNKYIGQLKEIYNILNRIGVLEHRLSTLDTYSDIAQGKEYGELLGERLEYNEELLDQYRFLVSEQKQFTNGYKDFIGTVDGLEGVFDFDKFGQIIINWEKYNSLQSTAAKGQVSLKEKADDVYNTYTSMFKELQGYFDNYIKYLQNILKLLNESRDAYVELENKTANAVQQIYQKILNTKLEAIDAEKEALDDLKKAREQANKDTKNAKELSGMQTNMQRALMDTSGASDSAFIKAQMDMNNKLDEIAEDKYSSMIQDLQDTLEDEKEMLQREFDEMFDNLDWLFDFLDTSIMSDPDSIQNILKQTDEWNQKSPTEKWQDMRDWDKLFNTYYQTEIFGEKGIKGVLQEIEKNEARIAEIDQVLKNQNTKGDANIIQTIEKWGQNVASAASSAASRSYGGGGGGGSPSSYGGKTPDANATPGGHNGAWEGVYTKASIGAYNVRVNKDALDSNGMVDSSKVFSTKDDYGVSYQPNNIDGKKLHKTGQTAGQIGITKNSSGYDVSGQSVWGVPDKMNIYVWNGTLGKYENVGWLRQFAGNTYDKKKHQAIKFLQGGLANFTGPAWMDGTASQPEAVLNALQTKHFLDFTDALSKMYSGVNGATPTMGNSINVGSISFEVESMSSPEDGEKAFNMFVDKFKEIGNQTGIKINTFKNTL